MISNGFLNGQKFEKEFTLQSNNFHAIYHSFQSGIHAAKIF